MRTEKTARRASVPPPHECRRAFVSRGLDLLWRAKRASDGLTIAEGDIKTDAKHKAEALGYTIL